MTTVSIPESKDQSSRLKRTIFEPVRFGDECAFLQLTPRVGIKIFPTRFSAHYAMLRQIKAYTKRIAPRVLSDIQICPITSEIFRQDKNLLFQHGTCGYFYRTQVARIRYLAYYKRYVNIVHKMRKSLNELGMYSEDLHEDNIGKIGKRWVIIDFGLLSVI
jgi:hypothetical protein